MGIGVIGMVAKDYYISSSWGLLSTILFSVFLGSFPGILIERSAHASQGLWSVLLCAMALPRAMIEEIPVLPVFPAFPRFLQLHLDSLLAVTMGNI